MPAEPLVIFMTSNGVGMGHLSRQLTTVMSGSGGFSAIIFSLSGALPRIIAADADGELPELQGTSVRYEYCPSWESGWRPTTGWRATVRKRYRSYRWTPYLRDRILALALETRASALVFDGVFPYHGLLEARHKLPNIKFIWIRRGMWQPGTPTQRLDLSENFDLTIEPGDYGAAADRGPAAGREDARRVAPICLTNVLVPTDRDTARERLGLPADRQVMLLAPGSGALGPVEHVADTVLHRLRQADEPWTVAVTRQSIARHAIGAGNDDVVVIDDVFPLARHLAAFDAAVGAAGYNAVHELLSAGIPTLLVPSTQHVTDDQQARASGVAERGAALVADGANLSSALLDLIDPSTRSKLRAQCNTLPSPDGGIEVGRHVTELAMAGTPTRGAFEWRAPRRPFVDLRAPARAGTATAIRFTEQVDRADLRDQRPLEHLLPGSSAEYRGARKRTAAWLYRV